MDAVADYAAVRAALANPTLPAYVSYVVQSHAGFDAMGGDDTTTIVVRTSDGKIVAGTPPKMKIDADHGYAFDIVRDGPFKPECYEAVGAASATFEGHPAEAIALHGICPAKTTSEHERDTDFSTLYADPATHRPIAVTGSTEEQYVKVNLDERFGLAGGFVLPESFGVKVAGSGPMFWLNVDARQRYSDYRFLTQPPQ